MKSFAFLGFLVLLVLSSGCRQITVTPAADSVGRYGIYELTVVSERASFVNPWETVGVWAQLTHTSGQSVRIDGFYYSNNQWKIRFSPHLSGTWQWTVFFKFPQTTAVATGAFQCEASDHAGFVRWHPANPYRLVFDNGSLFNGIGIGDCILDVDRDGNPLNNWGMDGGFRQSGDPDYGRIVDMPIYMGTYGARGAGFNLFRWSIDNCAFKLWETISMSGNRYLTQEGIWGDELVRALRQHGFRIWLTFFNEPPYPNAAQNPEEQAAIKRYLQYVVARYGAYVDVWELMNEAHVSAEWINFAADYVRSIDPYHHLLTTSWERPELHTVDINTPHWYERESEFQSDTRTAEMIDSGRRWRKPVIFGEQGNTSQNWDERSALRMRIRSWTAFFLEGVLIFWNSSFAKDLISPDSTANLYIGPEERRYIRVLQDFTALADADVRPVSLSSSDPGVRVYGLQSSKYLLAYLHHFSDHNSTIQTSLTVNLPAAGTLTWIDPSSGDALGSTDLSYGPTTLNMPPFSVDLAMRIKF